MDLSKWLPIFVGGLTEIEEPYRFFAIEGTKVLVKEAKGRLHQLAEHVVGGLHRWGPPSRQFQKNVVGVCAFLTLVLAMGENPWGIFLWQ